MPSSTDSPTLEKNSLDLKGDHQVITTDVLVTDISSMTEKEKHALYRKIDWHLLPVLVILFTMSFVDRGNIGNALSLGMIKDLDLAVGVRANLVTSFFYIAYFIFEVPSQIMLKLTSPSRWIPSTMIAWGIVLTLTCLVKSYQGILASRFMLGVTEAGVVPGTMFYLSLWYPRKEVARRAAYFLSTAAVGLAWGGILAYGINKMEGLGGLHGWAWIFAIEGILTVILGVIGLIFMHDVRSFFIYNLLRLSIWMLIPLLRQYPDKATFLTEKERAQILEILREDGRGAPREFRWKYIKAALLDWKVYNLVLIYLGVLTTTFDIALFLPTIIKDLGFSAANAQLLMCPPHMLAWPITVSMSMLSDKFNVRGPFLCVFSTIGMIGFAILRSERGEGAVGYVATFFATIGSAACIPISITWIGTNSGGELKRAAVLGIVLGLGSLGGIISSFTFRTKDSPRYALGHSVALGMLGLIFVSSAFLSIALHFKNKAKEARCKRENIDISRAAEFAELNDDSPLFRYTI